MNEIHDADNQYEKLRKLLMRHREQSSVIPSGSSFEIPAEYFLSIPTDMDLMVCSKVAVAFPLSGHDLKPEYREDLLLIDTTDCHVGFTRLRKINNTWELYRKPFSNELPETRGPAWEKFVGTRLNQVILGPLEERWLNMSKMKTDMVYAVHCPVWPAVAKEWLNRERKISWPPPIIRDEIVKLGCHLVAKPHQSNPNDDKQWRFSFSQAELILINSWTDVQKYIYHVLRVIKSQVIKACGGEESTVVCTYLFKTLMFWACEEKPREFWEENNLETSIGELVCTMIEWLIEKHCPNYFIRDNNMIDHLSDEVDLSKEISCLLQIKVNFISDIVSKFAKAYTMSPMQYTIPRKLIAFWVLSINTQHLKINTPWTWPKMNKWKLYSDHFVPELRSLFQGIGLHKSIVGLKYKSLCRINDSDVDAEKQLKFEARKYFEIAMNARDNRCCSVLLNLNLSLGENLQQMLNLADDNCTEYKEDEDENSGECADSEAFDFIPLMKAAASLLPSPALLLSTAYYVNFLYTVMRDYKSAAEQVTKCFGYLKKLENFLFSFNVNSLKNAFVVSLTNEWSELFDEYIQIILGFLTLYTSLSRSRSGPYRCRKIIVELSPLVFLEYIYFQSIRKLNKHGSVDFQCDFSKTLKVVLFEKNGRSYISYIFLFCAICASGIRRKKTGETTYSVQ